MAPMKAYYLCADCGGIKTTLKINSDATYDLRSEYLGEENGILKRAVYII